MNAAIEEDPNYKKILAFLLKAKGFDGHHYKSNYIKRRIAVRMRAAGVSTYQDYLHVLQNNRQEPSFLFDRLTIHVTEFFRDSEVYEAIREKILPVFSSSPEKKIKVWCAGCSTGEEPYSVAMMLEEWCFSHPGFDFTILATDIDGASIRAAEKAEYPMESLQKLSKGHISQWFHVAGTTARVIPTIKHRVRFWTHDLLGEWSAGLSKFNLVFCRNMLIYLTAPQQQKIYEQFASALLPASYLILGLTETLLGPSRKFFKCVDVKHRIYQVSEKIAESEISNRSS
jgi:chemotaxis protein methyltransferase CheR